MTHEDTLYTVDEVAERLRVNERTVRRWIRAGLLGAADLGKKAGYRIPGRELSKFLDERLAAPKIAPGDVESKP